MELHHRMFRSRGGAHTLANLVALCGHGNADGCHGWAHTEGIKATADGYQIRSNGDPEAVPILLVTGFWKLLTPEGRAEVIPIWDAIEFMHLIGAIREDPEMSRSRYGMVPE